MSRFVIASMFIIGLGLIISAFPMFNYIHVFDKTAFDRMESAGLPEQTVAILGSVKHLG